GRKVTCRNGLCLLNLGRAAATSRASDARGSTGVASTNARQIEDVMGQALLRRESAVEYFKELVDGALAHQRITAGELTAFYVVQMLAGFLQRPTSDDEAPLGMRLAQALEAGGIQQRVSLREIGDASLFISGFFADSLRR